ncbi:hypothetical protein PL373_18675 [Tenacibaculum maritimum]|nr:hypothetical protein [Tenacibaculum maritimum]MDB0599763.1 hypothetical protein [Tenacibaculum maritimum]MDB0603115.1 hypothetical protein [Tenacibaculum maritimum]MDB0610379.1 hypothetical protein [Tenacibaculum maritimum]
MSFITSEKPVQLHTLEKGTHFVKSFKGLPCSQIFKVGSLIDYCSLDYFLCEKIDGSGNLLLRECRLVFPLTSPRYYPTFPELSLSKSLSFDSESFMFLEGYFESLPAAYLESVDGIDFFVQYRRFLALYVESLQLKVDSVHAKLESFRSSSLKSFLRKNPNLKF